MTQTNDAPAGLREALAAAAAAFVRGNAEPLKALFSHRDDVTILGAFGGFEQGWDLVGPRLDWASSQFRDGVWSCTTCPRTLPKTWLVWSTSSVRKGCWGVDTRGLTRSCG
jgi:hypothetical protein